MTVVEPPAPRSPAALIAAESPVLTLKEAAELLRIHPSTAKKWAARGELPGVLPKLGGQWRISAKALQDYIDSAGASGPSAS